MAECIFCKIARKEIPNEFLYEDADVIAFADINPLAPVHVLVIPRRHISSVNDFMAEDAVLIGKLILAARAIAREKRIADDGDKLLFRTGEHGGQEVPHVHLHLIGGAPLTENIHSV